MQDTDTKNTKDDKNCAVCHAKSIKKKSGIIYYAKNVKNHATFVEGFWPEFL